MAPVRVLGQTQKLLTRTERVASIHAGVLQLVHGDDETFMQEANSSRACVEATFGSSLPVTIASAEDVTCRFRQQGTPEEEDCWAALMAAKVRAAQWAKNGLVVSNVSGVVEHYR